MYCLFFIHFYHFLLLAQKPDTKQPDFNLYDTQSKEKFFFPRAPCLKIVKKKELKRPVNFHEQDVLFDEKYKRVFSRDYLLQKEKQLELYMNQSPSNVKLRQDGNPNNILLNL